MPMNSPRAHIWACHDFAHNSVNFRPFNYIAALKRSKIFD